PRGLGGGGGGAAARGGRVARAERPRRRTAARGAGGDGAGRRARLDRGGAVRRDRGGGGNGRRRRAAGRRAGVGAPAAAPRQGRGRGRAPRALDSHLSHERRGPRGAARAGAGEGSDSALMRRREFLEAVGRYGGMAVGAGLFQFVPPDRLTALPSLLIPMDESQSDHLKAYGVAHRLPQAGLKAEWLLNYRGGSFLVPDGVAIRREAALAGVALEPVDDARVTAIRGEIAGANADAVPLEKAPKVAVYVSPNAPPWDDAVTMALQYAGIPFTKIWDPEVIGGGLKDYDWLHLHHEDFTGQYSKFYLIYAGSPWLAEMVRSNQTAARQLGFENVPDLKKGVARQIREYVGNGGFLFAMCTATETLDLALAAERVDIAASYADGTPPDPQADAKLDWSRPLAV